MKSMFRKTIYSIGIILAVLVFSACKDKNKEDNNNNETTKLEFSVKIVDGEYYSEVAPGTDMTAIFLRNEENVNTDKKEGAIVQLCILTASNDKTALIPGTYPVVESIGKPTHNTVLTGKEGKGSMYIEVSEGNMKSYVSLAGGELEIAGTEGNYTVTANFEFHDKTSAQYSYSGAIELIDTRESE